ncbi:MAG: T9SS type A sorting domain-containing protein [Bacteroidetes bacterium]|nr:T9SS type A sorting domain-containing protein [Bacteroidota bacterium]
MIKNCLALCFGLISYVNISFAQVTFQKIYGGPEKDFTSSVRQTPDGGYILACNTQGTTNTSPNIYLLKTDNNGIILWSKTIGGTAYESASAVESTFDKGFIIWGQKFTPVGALSGIWSLLLIKADSIGGILWTKEFNFTNGDDANSIKQTKDGGFIIAGSGNHGNIVYIFRTDSIGNTSWAKKFDGVSNERASSVQETADGGYIISGYTRSFGAGDDDFYLIKTDSTGNLLFSKTFGGAGSDISNSSLQTADGGFIVLGTTNSFASGTIDVYLVKTDSAGNLMWSKTYGGPGSDFGYRIEQTSDGGFVISGHTNSFGAGSNDALIIKTNSTGSLLWSKTYGGLQSDYGLSILQTTDKGFILGGTTESFGAAGGDDVYLIKTDSLGNSGCNFTVSAFIEGTPLTVVTIPLNTESALVAYSGTSSVPSINGGFTSTILCMTSTKEKEVTTDLFNIFPNPTSDNFTISFNKKITKGFLQIFNLLGNKVFEENIFEQSQKEIQLKSISPGIYFVKVLDGEYEYCSKLILEYGEN